MDSGPTRVRFLALGVKAEQSSSHRQRNLRENINFKFNQKGEELLFRITAVDFLGYC